MREGEAVLVVRSHVDPEVWDAFNQWYEEDHTPTAKARLGAQEAWRAEILDAHVHIAFYRFPSTDVLRERLGSDEAGDLMSEFDQRWPTHVQRTREIWSIRQHSGGVDT